ncbi:hypothetical protein PPYR_13125 [Photinus pyralis]|uniref:Uncharacterized protein n=1 Tax=Photinus pyralis TaxID=7054 RepID=A0A5N4A867_PHOPY|nr:uncharacterized protein LOC116178963 [Photinus pyralis]XP_031354492.1 uncharacterized protein LOC116178963 [Photinus pyralis]XP_031354493.1 uncharacterized protein LOC116178963 [Photinus pyralis]KAB0793505.1 hypothetical protein PPYR_13125 [Photinus pyralis]
MICFKFVLTLLLNISLVRTLKVSDLDEHDYDCMKLLNLTVDFVMDGFNRYNFLTVGDSELNEFVSCSWSKAGYLTGGSKIDANKIKVWMHENLVKKTPDAKVTAEDLVEPCRDVTGRDSGDTVVKVYNCMMTIWWQSRW